MNMFLASLLPIVLFVLLIFIAGVILYFWHVYRKERKLLDDESLLLHQYEHILFHAHKKARNIIQHASEEAEKLLAKSTGIRKEAVTLVHKRLNAETQETLHLYEEMLGDIKKQTLSQEQQALAQLTKHAEEDLHTYSQSITTSLQNAQGTIKQQAEQEMQQIKQELALYKEEQQKHIDEKIMEIIDHLALEIFGKSLRTTEQKALIEKALEQAAKEGVFEG